MDIDVEHDNLIEANDALRAGLIDRMKTLFGADSPRIDHALAVLGHAETIMVAGEKLDAMVVRAAAILHDIGIQEAERKHGSSAGRYQEIEGPPIARTILADMGVDAERTEHVCRIVGSHHSARDIDTPEFRVIWDADWLVNIPDEYDTTDAVRMGELVETVFRTDHGKDIARTLFFERKEQ